MINLKLRLHIEGSPERIVSVAQEEFIVGRLPECDLCLPYSEVSRHHSRFFRNEQYQWYVEDLGSTNGTIVNQVVIPGAHPLQENDVIQIGNAFMVVYILDSEQGKNTLATPNLENHTILRNAEELKQQWLKAGVEEETYIAQQRTIARLQYLVEISKRLSSAETIEAIFEKVQAIAFQELSSIQRLALLVDVDRNGSLKLIDAAARPHLPNPLETRNHDWISRSICKKVFHDQVAIQTVDAQEDERFEGEHSILAKGIHGALAVPLWDKNQVVGVLYADASLHQKKPESLHDEEDLSFFSTIANLVASSVQRWLLTRQLQGEEHIRQQLERYHSPAVVQQLIAVGALNNGRLQPKEADLSIIFADIVGFSAMSERMTPTQIAQLLDRFFEEMLKYVFALGGTLDKFIGDCIMAFFGAPEPQPDHADRAVKVALGMLKRLDELNRQGTWPEPLQLHIAINSGKAVVGDVGSSQRVDYTVLGGTVNVAARLEGICPPSECVISEATFKRLKKRDDFILMGERQLKGIDRPIQVYQTKRRHRIIDN
ncbi:adenylate/guanylate cyclase domain-containing protein [Spirulina sp. CS-785/01]|uniref:adenylate/guanylate cyclase domain-containing protein n=1 Tax=Spirulina sp. CS-785/01 TaxID=3021716 RepID=UPI00232F5BA4|nr:adenylate/guanylate cyclase domain-containing protein [Spirulina sp. CS-785/01]MDB9315657.1 adenylate/guanylate cyclase domain-containing protein [Spirulina sp. CS-785/01]